MKTPDKSVATLALTLVAAVQTLPSAAGADVSLASFMTPSECLEMGYELEGRVCKDYFARSLDSCLDMAGTERAVFDANGDRMSDLTWHGAQKCQVITRPDAGCPADSQDPHCTMTGRSCDRIGGHESQRGTCLVRSEHIVDTCSQLGGNLITNGRPACEFKMTDGRNALCEGSFEGELSITPFKPRPNERWYQWVCRIGEELAQTEQECELVNGTFADGSCVVPIAELPPVPQCFKIYPLTYGINKNIPVAKQECLALDNQLDERSRNVSFYKWATAINEPGLRWNATLPFTPRKAIPQLAPPGPRPGFFDKGGVGYLLLTPGPHYPLRP